MHYNVEKWINKIKQMSLIKNTVFLMMTATSDVMQHFILQVNNTFISYKLIFLIHKCYQT